MTLIKIGYPKNYDSINDSINDPITDPISYLEQIQ